MRSLKSEWERSIHAIEDILHDRVQVACVPGGYYSDRVALSAARAGIRLLFNSEPVTSTGRQKAIIRDNSGDGIRYRLNFEF